MQSWFFKKKILSCIFLDHEDLNLNFPEECILRSTSFEDFGHRQVKQNTTITILHPLLESSGSTRSVESLSNTIEEFINLTFSEIKKLGLYGRKAVENYFDQRKVNDLYLKTINCIFLSSGCIFCMF